MRKYFSILLIVLITASTFSIQFAKAQSSIPAWAPGVAYSIGNLVSYGGSTYKCIQAHTSQVGWEPPYVPALWQLQTGTAVPTNTTVARTNTPTSAPTATRPPATATATATKPPATATPISSTATVTPTKPPATATTTSTKPPATATSAPPTATRSSIPAWTPGVSYVIGNLVTYGGSIYKCITAHTSQVGWEPPNVPALWQLQTGTPVPTFQPPTNTPNGPTPTNAATATSVAGAPAKPAVSISAVTGSATAYDVTWNIWYGTNGTSWTLLENGLSIYSASVVANSPNAQTGTFRVNNRVYGAFAYQVAVSNASGTTMSDPTNYTVGGAGLISLTGYDNTRQALQLTINQGAIDIPIVMLGKSNASFTLATNNPSVISFQLNSGNTLHLQGLAAGRASLRIQEAGGETRYVGVRVRTASGQNPGMPNYVAIGSESEDIPVDLTFWRGFGNSATNKRVDLRYIYLLQGWRNPANSSINQDGGRLIVSLRESLKLGMIPFFVYYSIPDGGSESYALDLQHMQSASYLQGYFTDLKFATDIIRQEAGDELVGFVMEPDFIGYMMQNSNGRTPIPADQLMAATSAAYSSGVLNSTSDPAFPNSLQGLVKAVNYTIKKYAPNPFVGWEFSLWASPGITTSIPSNGLMHITDTMGITAGRQALVNETQAICNYYLNAGVTYNANFVSVDKYGFDAGSTSPDNPSASPWFWNGDHWNNYLLFTSTMHTSTALPVMPWQIPQGHVNTTQTSNPYPGYNNVFPPLPNTSTKYEDSAPTFFLGDSFQPGSSTRLTYFSTNQGGDPKITVSGSTVTWASHMQEAKNSGIIGIMFGPGVGASTDGVGTPPSDDYWWITKVQKYYTAPVSLP